MIAAEKITYHAKTVTREERAALLRQTGATLWFTGLSGSGKSTIAVALEQALVSAGHAAYVLDGDNVRFGLNAGAKILMETRGVPEAAARRFGLGFSTEDREENIRRVGEVAKLFADAGLVCIVSLISPYRKDRDAVRRVHAEAVGGAIPFIEVHISTPLAACEARDPKGLYRQARAAVAAGQGLGFTGIDDPYEAPANPSLTIDASTMSVAAAIAEVLAYLRTHGVIRAA
jgi:adenylylsulfate kinase